MIYFHSHSKIGLFQTRSQGQSGRVGENPGNQFGLNLDPRPHYSARTMRLVSRGPIASETSPK